MKEIPLTRGKVALVDDDDFEELSKYKWHCMKYRDKLYARRCVGRNTKIYMHRHIAGDPEGLVVDHGDGNGLNNQKYNLRNCTQRENTCNRPARINSSSFFKGVSRDGNRWVAKITHEGITKFIGSFSDEIEAAMAYDREAWNLQGAFAQTNFDI